MFAQDHTASKLEVTQVFLAEENAETKEQTQESTGQAQGNARDSVCLKDMVNERPSYDRWLKGRLAQSREVFSIKSEEFSLYRECP